jgi:hypothetical protein
MMVNVSLRFVLSEIFVFDSWIATFNFVVLLSSTIDSFPTRWVAGSIRLQSDDYNRIPPASACLILAAPS